MAVNKNFVVKNGIEVATDLIYGTSTLNKVGIGSTIPASTLDVRGGIAATDITASGYIEVTGTATFSDSATIAGVTTLASSGGITTTGGDFYVGGDLYVSDDVVYDAVSGRELYISGIGTIVDLTSTNVNVTGLATASHGLRATAGGINVVAGVSTFAALVDVDAGADLVGGVTADNINVTGVLTATSVVGAAQIGVSSEGTYIGTGASVINFASSNSTAWTVTEPSAGVATVTVTPGASIGLVLALS